MGEGGDWGRALSRVTKTSLNETDFVDAKNRAPLPSIKTRLSPGSILRTFIICRASWPVMEHSLLFVLICSTKKRLKLLFLVAFYNDLMSKRQFIA